MLYIRNPSRNPYFNLALEEHVLRGLPKRDSYFMLWQNDPAVIIGASQNTIDEIDPTYIRRHGVHVVRRRSGGGAVYHDHGNLNFSFVTDRTGGRAFDFQRFTVPVIRTLHQLGISSAFSSRNDLVIGHRKFSGNAQYVTSDRLLHHGTLLVHSDLDNLQRALSVSREKFGAKGISTVRSRVTNISDHLGERMPVNRLMRLLLAAIAEEEQGLSEYVLTRADLDAVRRLMRARYLRRDWNFGPYAQFDVRRSHRFAGGRVEACLGMGYGRIQQSKFYGDFFGLGNPGDLERRLIGHRRDRSEIRDLLDSVDVAHYFHQVDKEGLLDLIV